MGDLSIEPSMEDILSSIKRIIAEEGDGTPGRGRRPARGPAPRHEPVADPIGSTDEEDDQVLELSDPMPVAEPVAAPRPAPRPEPTPRTEPAPRAEPTPRAEPAMSRDTVAASRGALDQLSRLIVKPEPESDGTLEGLVRQMLRPMLGEWLDAHLPGIVETMVAREIAKITDQPR